LKANNWSQIKSSDLTMPPRKRKQKRGSWLHIESKQLKPDWKQFLPVESRAWLERHQKLTWHWKQKVESRLKAVTSACTFNRIWASTKTKPKKQETHCTLKANTWSQIESSCFKMKAQSHRLTLASKKNEKKRKLTRHWKQTVEARLKALALMESTWVEKPKRTRNQKEEAHLTLKAQSWNEIENICFQLKVKQLQLDSSLRSRATVTSHSIKRDWCLWKRMLYCILRSRNADESTLKAHSTLKANNWSQIENSCFKLKAESVMRKATKAQANSTLKANSWSQIKRSDFTMCLQSNLANENESKKEEAH
jgi:hypothetical protein